jgi:hypothetical protein
MRAWPFICCAVLWLSATIPAAAQNTGRDSVLVFDSTEIPFDSYIVVQRLGVQSWRSAIGIPTFRDEESARSAALAEAARSGADAVVNLHCVSQGDSLFTRAGHYCYGNAIKLKNERQVAAQ